MTNQKPVQLTATKIGMALTIKYLGTVAPTGGSALMKRYFFNIRTTAQLDRDTIGTECSCDEDAIAEAHQAAREIVAEWVLEQHVIDGETFEIIDERGELVARLRFKDVLRLH